MPIETMLENLSVLATTLRAETEELNGVISDLNDRLAKIGLGISVWLDLDARLLDEKSVDTCDDAGRGVIESTGWTLGYSKVDDAWTLAVRKETLTRDPLDKDFPQPIGASYEEPIALLKAPRNVRVEAAGCFEPLLAALEERAATFVKSIYAAKQLAGGK